MLLALTLPWYMRLMRRVFLPDSSSDFTVTVTDGSLIPCSRRFADSCAASTELRSSVTPVMMAVRAAPSTARVRRLMMALAMLY
ncbi:hypothetical protein D3C81_1549900 [compost metagenome]